MTDPLAHHDIAGCSETGRAAHVFRHESRRNAAQIILFGIPSGQDGDDAGRGLGGGRLDRGNIGVGDGRVDHCGVGLMRQVEIVDIAAPAGQETRILGSRDWLSNAKIHGNPVLHR